MKHSYRLVIVSIFALLFGISACNNSNEATITQYIDGIITNSADEPISNATVEAISGEDEVLSSDNTDEEGYFKLKNLPEDLGGINIQISKEGYETFIGGISDFKNESEGTLSSIMLEEEKDNLDSCCKGILTVHIYELEDDGDDGDEVEKVENGKVKLFAGDKLIETISFTNGKAMFDGVCEDEYLISVSADEFETKQIEYAHPCNETVEKEVFLLEEDDNEDCCGLIQVCAVDSKTGNPINDVEIKLSSKDKIIEKKYTSSDDSCVEFEDLCEDDYWVRIYKDGYEVIEHDFELEECDTIKIEKELVAKTDEPCDTAKLKVKVKDTKTEQYVKNVPVYIYQGDKLIREGNTGDLGYKLFEELTAPGTYTAVVKTTDNYEGGEFTYTFDECKEIHETLWITSKGNNNDTTKTAKLKVKVKNSKTKSYIKNTNVRLVQNFNTIQEENTGEAGYVLFEGLTAPGNYSAIVEDTDEYWGELVTVKFEKSEEKVEIIWVTPKDECCDGILKVYAVDSETGKTITTKGSIILRQKEQSYGNADLIDGKAIIDGICEGVYFVDVMIEGYAQNGFEYVHSCNKTIEQTVKMKKE